MLGIIYTHLALRLYVPLGLMHYTGYIPCTQDITNTYNPEETFPAMNVIQHTFARKSLSFYSCCVYYHTHYI